MRFSLESVLENLVVGGEMGLWYLFSHLLFATCSRGGQADGHEEIILIFFLHIMDVGDGRDDEHS